MRFRIVNLGQMAPSIVTGGTFAPPSPAGPPTETNPELAKTPYGSYVDEACLAARKFKKAGDQDDREGASNWAEQFFTYMQRRAARQYEDAIWDALYKYCPDVTSQLNTLRNEWNMRIKYGHIPHKPVQTPVPTPTGMVTPRIPEPVATSFTPSEMTVTPGSEFGGVPVSELTPPAYAPVATGGGGMSEYEKQVQSYMEKLEEYQRVATESRRRADEQIRASNEARIKAEEELRRKYEAVATESAGPVPCPEGQLRLPDGSCGTSTAYQPRVSSGLLNVAFGGFGGGGGVVAPSLTGRFPVRNLAMRG